MLQFEVYLILTKVWNIMNLITDQTLLVNRTHIVSDSVYDLLRSHLTLKV